MDPYRTDEKNREIDPTSGASDDWEVLVWILLLGLLLVVYEAGQPEPFGSVGTLGMLISFLALKSLVRRRS